MVKVGFFILAGLDEQIGMLNGFLTGLLLSFPPPLPQPINEGGDEEEQRADEAEEIAERYDTISYEILVKCALRAEKEYII